MWHVYMPIAVSADCSPLQSSTNLSLYPLRNSSWTPLSIATKSSAIVTFVLGEILSDYRQDGRQN